jgi:subtilisin family serine protease
MAKRCRMQSRLTMPMGFARVCRLLGGAAAALFALLLCSTFNAGPDGGSLGSARWAGRVSAADATPDCGNLPPDPHPALQRAKRLARLGVDRWHAAGLRGRGLKIAVLDSGFRGYREHLGKALPAHVLTRSFRSDGNLESKDSQHGILCAEVLHALAPDAELLLANWDPERSDDFLAAARWARSQGARVISCSVIMPSWSDGEGKGPVHEALARILGPGTNPGDMLLFASAGNVAQRHWSGPFHDAGDGWHEWATSIKDNELSPWGKEHVSVEMCWEPGADYDLFVNDTKTGRDIGHSVTRPGERRSCAVVRFLPHGNHTYQVRVRFAGGRAGSFHLSALGGGLLYSTAKGSITFPGDGPEVIAVGAVDSDGQRSGYSSCGPNSCRPKPDLVATVPFPSLWRPRPFTGTSAAAPQAAGLAALLWTSHPDWTAYQIRDTLQKSARDLGPPGHDVETGYGLISLPAAQALGATTTSTPR